MNATAPPPAFPPLPADALSEPFIRRNDAVNGTFRYFIAPANKNLRGSHPFSVITDSLYDCGTLITNLWSSQRTLEEAQDEIRYLEAWHGNQEYQKKIIYLENNLAGWTEISADIEARKMKSAKRNRGYTWEVIPAPHIGHKRFILKGTLKTTHTP